MKWKQPSPFPRELGGAAVVLLLLLVLLKWWAPHHDDAALIAAGEPGWRHAPTGQSLRLELNRKSLWRLRLKREAALKQGILVTAQDDWVLGTLWERQRSWPVKVRLKGDWTDHLQRGKWSLRVQVRGGGAYRGMRVFSLQSPHARSFLKEWLFHQVLRREGVLTTRYDFVSLRLNGADLGVYALEDHFTKEMLEAQHRPEGPVFKFSESGMWEARVEALHDTLFPYLAIPIFEAASVAPFQYGRIRGDARKQELLMLGQSLMHQYKHGLAPAGELLDLEKVARQYALTDLFLGHHSLIWHNRRYYFNPVLHKLEPVVYDAFAGGRGGQYLNGPFTGFACNGQTQYGIPEEKLGTLFFGEPAFVRAYYGYLFAWTEPAFLDSVWSEYAGQLAMRERLLRREFLNYRFDRSDLARRAEEIRGGLAAWDVDLVEAERLPDSSWCVHNLGPLPLEIEAWRDAAGEVHDLKGRCLLDAFDGNVVPWRVVPGWAAEALRVRVPGDRSSAGAWLILPVGK